MNCGSEKNYCSRLERLLREGQFVVTTEIGPPKGASAHEMRELVHELKDYADAMNITDNQTAVVRLSSIAGAVHVLNEGGEPVMQMTCRDRNRIAMQSDILGAYSLGVRNILCLSGDHQKFGNHPTSKNVYDLDSVQLIDMVRRMRDEGKFLCGEPLEGGPIRMFIGAAENPFADPFEYRALRLQKKVKAGAQFIQTQAIFDVEKFERWMGMVRDLGLHEKVAILAGVVPAKSFGALRYMKEVPGMAVPDDLQARMKGVPKGKQAEEGIKICVETIQRVRQIPGVRGVHVMAIMWERKVPEIVTQAGLYPRPKI